MWRPRRGEARPRVGATATRGSAPIQKKKLMQESIYRPYLLYAEGGNFVASQRGDTSGDRAQCT